MNHRHRKVLHAIFEHPTNGNIAAKDIPAVLGELGAEIEERHGNRYAVTLKGHTVLFHHAHHSLPQDGVMQIRQFLSDCDIVPERDHPL
tara:strand:+ start:2932 stop:3198 length:267 start_codon:yes stop_codon:yes gene_type:complete